MIMLLSFLKVSALNENSVLVFGDTTRVLETTWIQTDLSGKIDHVKIDSICDLYDDILRKMPVPVFKLAEKDSKGEVNSEGIPITYDSINALILKRGYEQKVGRDTLNSIIREIKFDPKNPEYSIVTYSNLETGKVLMKVITRLNGEDLSIYYYSDQGLMRLTEVDFYYPLKINDVLYQHRMNCYFKNKLLASAVIVGNERLKTIIDSEDSMTLSFGTGTIFLIYKKLPKHLYKQPVLKST